MFYKCKYLHFCFVGAAANTAAAATAAAAIAAYPIRSSVEEIAFSGKSIIIIRSVCTVYVTKK